MARVFLLKSQKVAPKRVAARLIHQRHSILPVFEHNMETVLYWMRTLHFDIILMEHSDFNLEVCRRYRKSGGSLPILMLGLMGIESVVEALDSGADDMVSLSVHPRELLARVTALLRRPPPMPSTLVTVGDLTLRERDYTLTTGDRTIDVRPLEFALLKALMLWPNQTVPTYALMKTVWTESQPPSNEAFRQIVRTLRKKIEQAGAKTRISNSPGIGYSLDTPVEACA